MYFFTDMRFRHTSALSRHKWIHVSEFAYQCKLCNKGVNRKNHLDQHMDKKHRKKAHSP